MSRHLLIFILLALLSSALTYTVTEHFLISFLVGLIYGIAGIFLFTPRLEKFEKVNKRFHACYHFINNFIIALSIKKTLEPALESASFAMDQEFNEIMNGLEDLSALERLKYLSSDYYPFHIYQLFLQVVDIFIEEGGDILEMSKHLLEECRQQEEYLHTVDSMGKRKYIEITLLWTISLSILVILRFVLSNFYLAIKKQTIYLVGIALIMLMVLASIYLLVYRATSADIKGDPKYEKVV